MYKTIIMVIRTYFDKSNTLIYNSLTNTGQNPITEIYYGGDSDNPQYSRYIFHFDATRLISFYTGGTFPVLSAMTHILHFTNTGFFDSALMGSETSDGKARASSFDLIIFRINQPWDEGCGYDYDTNNIIGNNTVISTGPSNWIESQSLTNWSGGSGVYSGSPSGITVTTQHFDQGNENLEVDITSYVNSVLTGGTNYGLGIAYTKALEATPTTDLQYVGFFTRHTQTFYEPFIETSYNVHIQDDRSNFYLDKNNKLYLYVNVAGNPTNLDNLPTCKIYDNNDTLFSSYTTTAITHVTKGVYSIDIKVPSGSYNDCDMFTDIWSGITIGGINRAAIELGFGLKDSLGYYDIGDDSGLPKKAGFTISGLNNREKLQVGDIRKITVSSRIPYTVNQSQSLSNLKYRIYITEGTSQITVIDWELVEQAANSNYFLIDTLSLLSGNIYYIDLKFESNQEVTTNTNVISFEVVNLSETRDSQ